MQGELGGSRADRVVDLDDGEGPVGLDRVMGYLSEKEGSTKKTKGGGSS